MGMDIWLNKRIYVGAQYHDDMRVEISVNKGRELPPFNPGMVSEIIERLGSFRGYELAEFLGLHTTENGYAQDEWFFGEYMAKNLINRIDEAIDKQNPGNTFDSEELEDDFFEDLTEIRAILQRELEQGADYFEIVTSY